MWMKRETLVRLCAPHLAARRRRRRALGLSYGVALWAMTRAPVAVVAALRETSVIFAALIGAWLLKEGHIARRIAGAATVAAGVIALKI